MGAEPLPLPYLREALWQAGYAVDTLETATDWSNVDGLLQKIEASLRDGLAAEGEGSMCSPTSRMSWRGVEHLYHLRVPSGRELCGDAGALEASQACGQPGDRRQSRHHQPPAWRRQDHAPYLPREKGELGVAALRAMAGHFDPAGRLNRGTLLQD